LRYAAQVSALACTRPGADPPYAQDVVFPDPGTRTPS
jgi:hypothetical protein